MVLSVSMFKMINSISRSQLRYSFPLLADGSCRSVYDIGGGLVVKKATNEDGVIQCRMENHVYKHAVNYLKGYLCPVLWHAPGIVVMMKAVPVIPLNMVIGDPEIDISITGKGYRAYEDLKYLSREFGLLYEDLLSVTSWGYLGNRAVLIDYGCRE